MLQAQFVASSWNNRWVVLHVCVYVGLLVWPLASSVV